VRIEKSAVGRLEGQAGREGALMHGDAFDVGISRQAHAQLKMANRPNEHWLNAKAVVQFHPT
jgi:hypothetical protein